MFRSFSKLVCFAARKPIVRLSKHVLLSITHGSKLECLSLSLTYTFISNPGARHGVNPLRKVTFAVVTDSTDSKLVCFSLCYTSVMLG